MDLAASLICPGGSLEETRDQIVAIHVGRPDPMDYFRTQPHIEHHEKDELQALALIDKRNAEYTVEEQRALLDYCWSDVVGAKRLLDAVEGCLLK